MAVFSNPAGRFQENTRKLIDLLDGADFLHSQLPREVLEDRDPGQILCKMEFSAKISLCGELKHHRQLVLVDMDPIDEKLINLAERFKAYVRGGDKVSAQTSLEALEKGILDIRCNIPQNPDVPLDTFVKVNTDYLDKWLTVVGFAQEYDRQAKSLIAQRKLHAQTEQQLNQSIDRVYSRIERDPDFAEAFFHILEHDSLSERSRWTQAQREVHHELVEHRFTQLTQRFSNAQLASLEDDQLSVKLKIDTLKLYLAKVPVITDPDLMNKYKESMDQFIREKAESDEKLEETMRHTERLEAAMQHLEETSAVDRQQTVVVQSAQKTLDDIRKLNQPDSAPSYYARQLSDSHN